MANSTDKSNSESNSDIVVIPDNSSAVAPTRSKRQTKAKASALAKPAVQTTPPQMTKTDLVDVAITAADAPFVAAKRIFDDRYTSNFGSFLEYVGDVQSSTCDDVIDQLLGHYGLNEEELNAE